MSVHLGWIIAASGFILTLGVYVLRIGTHYGALEHRVKQLEDSAKDSRETRELVIAMNAQIKHMSAKIDELSTNLVWLTKTPQHAPQYGPPSPRESR